MNKDTLLLQSARFPSNGLESNRKTAHKVYLEWRASGSDTLTAAQFAEVSPIAHQCPSIGGTAVYLARALYQIKEPMRFNDDELCIPIEERYAAAKSSPQAKALLWPNPSKEQINLWIPTVPTNQVAHVRLMDVSGKTIQALDALLLEGNTTMDIGGLEAGMYFCRIQVDGKPEVILRFVVSK